MKGSERGISGKECLEDADKELETELKRLKFIKKMGWFKGRPIM